MGPFPERLLKDGHPRQHSSSQAFSCDSAHRPCNYVNFLRVQDGATTAADGSEGMRDALRGLEFKAEGGDETKLAGTGSVAAAVRARPVPPPEETRLVLSSASRRAQVSST